MSFAYRILTSEIYKNSHYSSEDHYFWVLFTSESFYLPRYVTIQRGQGAERPEPEEDRPQQVSAPSQSRKRVRVIANRARRPKVKRSAAEEPSFIYPSANLILNPRQPVDENEIPDGEIAYIFPFSPAHRRDQRQIDETTTVESASSPVDEIQETTSASTETKSLEEVPEINAELSRGPPYGNESTEASTSKEPTTTPSTPSTSTTSVSSNTTTSKATTSSNSASHATSTEVPEDTTEFDYGDYEVSVSVAKSISESISYANEVVKDIIEAVTSTMMPATDDAEENLVVTTTTTTTTETPTVETTTATTSLEVESTTTKRTIHSFFNKRKNGISNQPRRHPVLAGKTGDTTSKPAPSSTTRHSFFKSRTTTTTTTTSDTTPSTTKAVTEDSTTTVEATVETTEPPFLPTMNVEPVTEGASAPPSDEGATVEKMKEDITAPITTTETPTTTATEETTTTGNLVSSLKQRIQERKLKEMLAKKALKESIAANAERKVGAGILAANRNARPKFIPPSSLRKKFQSGSAKEVDNEVEPESKKASTTPRPATTRGLNRFRPFPRLLPGLKATSPPRTTITRARTTTIRRTPPTTPSPARTSRLPQAVDLSASPSKKVTSNQISRTRFRRPSLLTRPGTKPKPSAAAAAAATTTEATTTTTAKLTVGDIISNLNDGKPPEDKPVTLRPRSFKPKFGSKQRDKLRKRLNDQLKAELGGDEGAEKESVDKEPVIDAKTTAVPAETATTTGGRRKTISRTRVRPTVSAPRGTTKELPRTSGAPTPKIRRTQLRTRPRKPLIPSAAIAARTRPISAPRRPNLTTRTTVAPSTPVVKPGRTLSDADILSGLGLDTKATTESSSAATDADTTLSPSTQSGDSLLLQLVHGNKETLTTVQEDETTPSTESIIMKDSIFLLHPPSELNVGSVEDESEVVLQPQPTAGGGFSLGDLLKTAVVESNVDQQALEQQARKQNQRKKFIEQENADARKRLSNINNPSLNEVSVAATPSPVLAVKRVTSRVRSRHRFSPPAGTSASTSATTESTVSASASSPSGRDKFLHTRRQRIRNRVRGPSSQTSSAAATTGTTTTVTTQSTPTTRSRSRFTSRRRLPLGSSRVRGAEKEKAADSSVQEQEHEEPKASEGVRNDSAVRSRTRIALRRRGPASRQDSNSLVSDELDVSRSGSSASIGKSAAAESIRAAATHDVNDTNINQDTEEDEESLQEEDREHESTSRPKSFKPKFGSRQRNSVRNRLKDQLLSEKDIAKETTKAPTFSDETAKSGVEKAGTTQKAATTTPVPEVSTFRSVSPSSGISALPARLFVTTAAPPPQSVSGIVPGSPGVRFASFAPRLLEHELEEIDFAATHRPLERIERSTLSSEYGVSFLTDDYNKLGVSGRTFVEAQTTTSAPTATDATTTTEVEVEAAQKTTKGAPEPEADEAKREEKGSDEEAAKKGGRKVVIRKGLFGRKRPNFLKSRDSKKPVEDAKAKLFGNISKNNSILNRKRFQSSKALSNEIQVEEKSTTEQEKSTAKDNPPTSEPAIFVTTPSSVKEDILKQRRFNLPRKLGQRVELGEKSSAKDLLVTTSEPSVFVTTPTPSDKEDFKRRRFQLPRKLGKRVQLQTKKPKKLGKKVEVEEVTTAPTTELVKAAESAIVVTTPTSLADIENASIAGGLWNAGTARPSFPFRRPRRKLDLDGLKDLFGKGKKKKSGVARNSLLARPNVKTLGKSEIKFNKQTKYDNPLSSKAFEFSPTPAPFVPTPASKRARKKLSFDSKIEAWEKSTETPAPATVTTEAPTVFAATFAPSTALPPFLATANPQRLSLLKSRAKTRKPRRFGRKQFAADERAASGRPHLSTTSPTSPSPSPLSPNPTSSILSSSSSSFSIQSDQVEVVALDRTAPSPIKPI